MRKPALLLCLCGCFLGAMTLNEAEAHDLWLESAADGYVLYQGHRHSSHHGEEIVPYDPTFTRRAVCLHADGRAAPLPPDAAYPARFAGPCDGLTGVVRSWQTLETVKRIDAWSESMQQPPAARSPT